jgi:hypothetical protein
MTFLGPTLPDKWLIDGETGNVVDFATMATIVVLIFRKTKNSELYDATRNRSTLSTSFGDMNLWDGSSTL